MKKEILTPIVLAATIAWGGTAAGEEPIANEAQVATASEAPSQPTVVEEEEIESLEEIADKDKPATAATHVARMKVILAKVLEHLADARQDKDVLKLNCVNEKLTGVKGLLRISEQASVIMQESLARRDTETAAHEFEKVQIAARKCEQMMIESEACVGEMVVYSGDTNIEITVEGVADIDPVRMEPHLLIQVERPPAASPYF